MKQLNVILLAIWILLQFSSLAENTNKKYLKECDEVTKEMGVQSVINIFIIEGIPSLLKILTEIKFYLWFRFQLLHSY